MAAYNKSKRLDEVNKEINRIEQGFIDKYGEDYVDDLADKYDVGDRRQGESEEDYKRRVMEAAAEGGEVGAAEWLALDDERRNHYYKKGKGLGRTI